MGNQVDVTVLGLVGGAPWAHRPREPARISLVFGRTDASAFLADRLTQDSCPELDFKQTVRAARLFV